MVGYTDTNSLGTHPVFRGNGPISDDILPTP